MKKTMWYALSRPTFNRMYARMKSIAEPVVAIKFAITEATKRSTAFEIGVPRAFTFT